MAQSRFHGRYEGQGQVCQWPDCREEGEFRAPGSRGSGFDGPGNFRWFCLDHVREFNSGYDWFEGMNAEEIFAAQSPMAGWASDTRAFRPDAGIDGVPRWGDFADPLDAIGARAAGIKSRAAGQNTGEASVRFTKSEQEALTVMGLRGDTDRPKLRRRYSELVRRYHPDRNGGDRQYEARLGRVVDAYQMLRKSKALR